jgi:hypothetical protein
MGYIVLFRSLTEGSIVTQTTRVSGVAPRCFLGGFNRQRTSGSTLHAATWMNAARAEIDAFIPVLAFAIEFGLSMG